MRVPCAYTRALTLLIWRRGSHTQLVVATRILQHLEQTRTIKARRPAHPSRTRRHVHGFSTGVVWPSDGVPRTEAGRLRATARNETIPLSSSGRAPLQLLTPHVIIPPRVSAERDSHHRLQLSERTWPTGRALNTSMRSPAPKGPVPISARREPVSRGLPRIRHARACMHGGAETIYPVIPTKLSRPALGPAHVIRRHSSSLPIAHIDLLPVHCNLSCRAPRGNSVLQVGESAQSSLTPVLRDQQVLAEVRI